MRMNELP